MIPTLQRIVAEAPAVQPDLPAGWNYEGVFEIEGLDCASCYRNKGNGLVVLLSLATMDNDESFIHCSLSRRSRMPSWEDVKLVKDIFLGEEKEAFHVLPKKSEYINLHPYCLHLWMPYELKAYEQ